MIKTFVRKYYQRCRIKIFSYLSQPETQVIGSPIVLQPVEYRGLGTIRFGDKVQLGYSPSPFFYDGNVYLEVRSKEARIVFGNKIYCNNNLKVICERSSVTIGDNVLIGTNVEIIDSDFHELDPLKRNSGNHICMPVDIKQNVFIGSNSRIMKGVTIGENTVVANSSVVTKSFPENVVIGGNPAKIISQF
jgi:acetyltransferase-like isoleucine patch superfamily enzyme